jgi:thioredoxin-related protein
LVIKEAGDVTAAFPAFLWQLSFSGGILQEMRRTRLKIISLFVALSVLSASSAHAISWHRNLNSALRASSSRGKPVLVDFYTDWCGWCKKMDKDTYSHAGVKKEAANFICVKVNGDKNRDLVRKYNIKAYPTTLFLNSKGVAIERVRGYVPPSRFLPKMKAIATRYKPTSKAKKGKASPSGFNLSGILFSEENPKAIVNNNIVGIGDTVGGAKVVSISQYGVTLSGKDGEIVLKLE